MLPDDLQRLLPPVFAHRLLLSTDAQVSGRSAERVVDDLVNVVPVPAGADSRG